MIHDDIGIWSEIKLEIVKEYASAYSRILSKRKDPTFHHVYIDAFAGSGIHVSRTTGEFVLGSPLNALAVRPSFREFYFIDIDDIKVKSLQEIVEPREDVHFFGGDCNDILLNDVFPRVRYDQYRRGLCFLDPYKINLDWKVILTAAQMRSIEIFLNFSTHYLNRAILIRKRSNAVSEDNINRMNEFWGDSSWMDIAYRQQKTLFGHQEEKITNRELALAYQNRLNKIAGFEYVPEPIPMKNSMGTVVYYLFFASNKPVAKKIVEDIFKKYRTRGFS